MPATPFSILNFESLKWVWQAHFSSHSPVTFENGVSFIDVVMVLLTFFDTPNQKSLIWRFQFAVMEHIFHPVSSLPHLYTSFVKYNLKINHIPHSIFWGKSWVLGKFVRTTHTNRFSFFPICGFVTLFIIKFRIAAKCYGSVGFCQTLIKSLFSCSFITTQITASRTWKKL